MLLLHWLCMQRDYQLEVLKGCRCEILAIHINNLQQEAGNPDHSRLETISRFCDQQNVKLSVRSAANRSDHGEPVGPDNGSPKDNLALIDELLTAEALHADCSHILIGGDAARWASISLQSLFNFEESDAHFGNNWSDSIFRTSNTSCVPVIRPLRDLLPAEVALAAHFQGVPYVPDATLRKQQHESQVFHAFLLGMQKDFKSIVFNVLRTTDKLSEAATPIAGAPIA